MFEKNIKILVLLLCSVFALNAQAQQRFYVNIKGTIAQIESVKKRSEYRMSKNVDFCRGVKMPKPTAGWMCKKVGNTQAACSRQYECAFVDNKFNRKSESLRTYQAMKATPALTTSYSIALSSKPKFAARTASKPVAAKQVVRQRKVVKAVPTPTPTPMVQQQQSLEDDLFAELEEPQQEEAKQEEVKQNDDVFEDSFADEKPTSDKEESSSQSEESISIWNFLRLDLSLSQTSDETGSQTVIEGGWRPRWIFSKNWSFDARLGFAQRRAIADSDEEAFSILEMAGFLNRRLGNWRLSGGFGRQSWGGEGTLGAQTPTFFAAGASYLWTDTKMLGIEGVEFKYLSISDEAASSTMRIGLLFKF